MPVFKLILFILLLLVVSAFIIFNFGHTSSISIWPTEKGTFTDVPILLSFFVLYMLGLISAIPFFIGFRYRQRMRKKRAGDAPKKSKNEKARGKTRVLGTKPDHDESHDESADSEEEGETK